LIDLRKVREIINEHVRIAVGEIEEIEPRITFAVRGTDTLRYLGKEIWRVNVEYTPKPKKGEWSFRRTALFAIDAETGAILEFKEGWSWTR
jgi:hypothetical protein